MTRTETEAPRMKWKRLADPPLCEHPEQQLEASEGAILRTTITALIAVNPL
jgi:hypothetical protein